MNDDGTNIIVSQQRRDLIFGDWASSPRGRQVMGDHGIFEKQPHAKC